MNHTCPNCSSPCDCTEVLSARDLGLCQHDCDRENPSAIRPIWQEELDEHGRVVLAWWYEGTPDPVVQDLLSYLSQFPPTTRIRLDDPQDDR
jgi:hypothetical protein